MRKLRFKELKRLVTDVQPSIKDLPVQLDTGGFWVQAYVRACLFMNLFVCISWLECCFMKEREGGLIWDFLHWSAIAFSSSFFRAAFPSQAVRAWPENMLDFISTPGLGNNSSPVIPAVWELLPLFFPGCQLYWIPLSNIQKRMGLATAYEPMKCEHGASFWTNGIPARQARWLREDNNNLEFAKQPPGGSRPAVLGTALSSQFLLCFLFSLTSS